MLEQTAGLSADGCDTPAPPPVIIVATGLTSGLGLETLKQLIARDGVFRIIIGSRNISPTEQTSQLLTLRSSPRTSIEYLPLDLSSPISVTAFPKHVQDALQDSPIDILLLCAGMSAGERREIKLLESDLKVEETLYVNVLSQVLIVNRLLRMMATTGRISIVNSARHLNAPNRYPGISPETVDTELSSARWSAGKAYDVSKLVEMHFMFILQDRIKRSSERGRTVVSVRPGFIPETNLFRNVPWYGKLVLRWLIYYLPICTSVKTGGETTIRSLFDLSLPSGAYLSNGGIEQPAAACSDIGLRAAWERWLRDQGVWDGE